MRVSAIGDVMKIWVWALGSLVVGLWLTPVAYNGGKALFELSVSKDFNGVINKVAAWSGAAGLEDFFKICWPLAALVSGFPLIEWLRLGGRERVKGPWRVRLPHMAQLGREGGQPVKPNRWGALHALTGFLMTFGAFVLIGYAMVKAGAIALAAVMFGGIRFILGGFANAEAFDGETLTAVRLTGVIFGGGNLAQRLVIVFLPWFAFGCVLGWARWRTASVWFPAGLLMGWLLAERLFTKATQPMEIPDRLAGYLSSGSLQTGVIPLLGVLAIGWLVHLITHGYRHGAKVRD